MISDSELGYAVLYCSIDRYCNADKELGMSVYLQLTVCSLVCSLSSLYASRDPKTIVGDYRSWVNFTKHYLEPKQNFYLESVMWNKFCSIVWLADMGRFVLINCVIFVTLALFCRGMFFQIKLQAREQQIINVMWPSNQLNWNLNPMLYIEAVLV